MIEILDKPKSEETPEADRIICEAKEILLRNGWTQGGYQRHGSYCLVGALRRAAGSFEILYETEALQKLARSLSIEFVTRMRAEDSLVAWNDYPSRKKEEVIELLERNCNAG